MIPVLYDALETRFETNGIGPLMDAVTCYVDREVNGIVELEMQYPISGKRFGGIGMRSIIMAKPDPYTQAQPFRVYRVTKPMQGIVTVYARHIVYDLIGTPVDPFKATNAKDAMAALKENTAVESPFAFWTDKETVAEMVVSTPKGAWSLLGGSEGSVLDVYGGEYEFDRFAVRLHKRLGADRGVSIRYGKNLTSLEQDENCANVYTGVYPYWQGQDGDLLVLPERILPADGNYDHVRILSLDLSEEFEEKPTEEQLRTRARAYMRNNAIGVPDVSWSVSFVQLAQTEEYKNKALLEEIHLGDSVTVIFPKMGVNATARAVKTRYNVLLDRYESVSLGRVKANISDTIAGNSQKIYLESVRRKNDVRKLHSELTVQDGKIEAKVEKIGGAPESFGWELLVDSWTLRSKGVDVLKAYDGGITINGTIIAQSGKIGGFDIQKDYLSYNGATWENDVSYGAYIGINGIKIGAYFEVDMYGNLNAASGTFTGNVYAGNIQYGGNAGYFSGGGLGDRSVGGVKVGYNTISTTNTSGGINTSLGYADYANGVFNGWNIPSRIIAGSITAQDYFYFGNVQVKRRQVTVSTPDGGQATIVYLAA